MNPCCCSGIRFCEQCIDCDRVQAVLNGKVPLNSSHDVVVKQYGDERTSSCSFAVVEPSKYSFCWRCKSTFMMRDCVFRSCDDHNGLESHIDLRLDGLFVVPDFLTESEEQNVVTFLDNPSSDFTGWKPSQSGRRKQDFGPKANFKKRKLKLPDGAAMPKAMKSILERTSSLVSELTSGDFLIVEVSALEYFPENRSNIDPHIDDTWIWGDRVVGLNLLADSVITFVRNDGIGVDAFLPRGAFFLMSKGSRYDWMHGIRMENIPKRRISITVRELSSNLEIDSKLLQMIKEMAVNFL